MRSVFLLALAVSVVLFGCPPPPVPVPDAGMEPEDAGLDAGAPDAGRPMRDAGLPDAGFTAVAIADWCRTRALADCGRDVRCGRLAERNVAACVLLRTSTAQCDQLAFSRAVTEGRQRYDEAAAVRCVNGYAAGSCEETPAACATVFEGLAPPDAGCLVPGDCSSAGFCDLYDGRCPHRCRAWEVLGAGCDGFTRRCDPASAACDEPDAGLTVCVPKKDAGAPCNRFDACGDQASCVSGQCVTRRVGPGERCGVTNGYPFCTEEYFCRQGPPDDNGVRPPGTCERKAGVGGTCTGPGSCLPSLRCSTLLTTGTCQPKAPVDAGCISYDDCEDTLFCNAKSQRCETLPDAGGDCSFERTGYRCAPGFTCAFSGTSEDRCVAWRPVGADCGYDGECLSNDCEFATLPDGGFGGRCIASCSQRADGGL